jgi:AcrR family transcriptional regulator
MTQITSAAIPDIERVHSLVERTPRLSEVAGAAAPALTRRALAKQQTRRRLLDAAKRLFNERGYEAATVRDIAAAAGLSTGAVFARFADKADLFGAVIMDDFDALAAHLAAADHAGATTEASLLRLFSAVYAFQHDHLPLVRAAIGHSWLGHPEAKAHMRAGVARILARVDDVLRAGVARGELSPNLDLCLINEMIWESFLANYRHAIFEACDAEAHAARLAAQVRILLAGWMAAAA